MSRRAKLAIVLVASAIALNVALSLVHALLGGSPGGPSSSSYATGSSGVAAYAALLAEAGHGLERLRERPSSVALAPSATVILLDPGVPLVAADADALRRFVAAGGRLVVGGAAGPWLERIVPDAPLWSRAGTGGVDTLAPVGALAGVRRLDAPGAGSWRGGAALPVLGTPAHALLSLADVGLGRVWLLADTAPLQNERLAAADDAALGLALAGPAARPVVFLESYHGYGQATGYAAIPGRWWFAFALLFAAVLTLMLASGRRFGPPELSRRQLPPPRSDYVESLAGILERSRERNDASGPVRKRLRRLIAARAGLGQTPSDEEIRAGARLLGVPEDEAAALTRPALNDADVVSLGRTLVRITRESRS